MGRPKGSKSKKIVNVNIEPIEKIKKPEDSQSSQNVNLKETVRGLTKQFGHEVIHFASEEKIRTKIAYPIDALNNLTGGGVQCGSFSVLWGNKSVAKTTIAYYCIASAQKTGKQCIYFDVENSFDKIWAEKCGVDLNRLLIARVNTAEEAMDALIKLSREKVIDFAVIDSVQGLSPKGEQYKGKGETEKSIEDDTMALLARKLSLFFRVSSSGVYQGNVAVLLIAQARTDLGSFIKLDKLSGGHGLEHWSVQTMKAFRGAKADAPTYKFKSKGQTKEIIIGFSLNFKLEKTKVSGSAPELSQIAVPFYYEYGFIRPTDEQIEALYKDWIEFEEE